MSFKRKVQKNKQLLLQSKELTSPINFDSSLLSSILKLPKGPIQDKQYWHDMSTAMAHEQLTNLSENRKKSFVKTFNELSYKHNAWTVWSDFIYMSACAISNRVDKAHYDKRESQYLSIIKKYDKKERDLFPKLLADTTMALERNPEQDFLGNIFMNLGLGNKHSGQFFTPYHVCEVMAEITLQDIVSLVRENGYVMVNDPCCGAGATLIAAANVAKHKLYKEKLNFQNHVFVVGQDIDQTAGLMCYIQLSLLGVAGYIKMGNALTEPIAEKDSDENYWYMPMYYSDVWAMRRVIKTVGKLTDNAILIDHKGERKNDEHEKEI